MSIIHLLLLYSRDGKYQISALLLFFSHNPSAHSFLQGLNPASEAFWTHSSRQPLSTNTDKICIPVLPPLRPTCIIFVFDILSLLLLGYLLSWLYQNCIYYLLQVLELCLILISEHKLRRFIYSRHTRCSEYTWDKCTVLRKKSWRRKWQPTPVLLPRESRGQSPGGLLSMGSHGVGHDWSDLACMHALEKEIATPSSILAWSIPGTEELVGCHLWGCTESDTTEET